MGTIHDQLRRLGVPSAMIAGALCNGRPIAEAKAKRADPYKSKWERLLALELADMAMRGEILDWAYEPLTFRLARGSDGKRGATYTPDFLVVHPGPRVEFIEVKGWCREAARVRFVTARELYPWFTWRMIRRGRNGWEDVL